jgi:predicted neuraminidase
MRMLAFSITCALMAVAVPADVFRETQLIFPPQDKHCHGSSIAELPNGDFLAVWFYGSGERTADDVMLQGARLKAGATAWSPVFEMADSPSVPDCNPVLHLDGENRLWLFWMAVVANKWESCLLKYRRASQLDGDGAPAWDWQDVILLQPGEDFSAQIAAGFKEIGYNQDMWAEYALPYDELIVEAAKDKLKRRIGWMARGHVVELGSGRMLLPLYSDGFNVSLVARSDDGGETWQTSNPIVGLGPIQPSIAQKAGGGLVAYLRDSGPPPRYIMRADSTDQGETWTVATDTDLLGSSASVQVVTLNDGRWVLLHNDTTGDRRRLAVSISSDEGESWHTRYLEDSPDGTGAYHYPAIIQAADGRLHMTYTHQEAPGKTIAHTVITPEWITAE